MNLILCAGERQVSGFTHHDVKPLNGIDIVCDLLDISKHVNNNSCDKIHFTHALEHFPTKQVPEVLQIVKNLLKEGGELYIEVPNFAWHATLILNEHRDRDAVYYCFGGQEDEWDYHKTGFTPLILKEDLEKAGFKNIRVIDGSSLTAYCNK